jgi:hypothetical protein
VDGSGSTYKSKRRSILRAKRAGGKNEIAQENRPKTDLEVTLPPARFARSIIQGGLFCRLDINHPPTAVGGILTFCAKPSHAVQRAVATWSSAQRDVPLTV